MQLSVCCFLFDQSQTKNSVVSYENTAHVDLKQQHSTYLNYFIKLSPHRSQSKEIKLNSSTC